jgi:L-alanine-DL-glutamate epimerase-like enolase superfamily enzyme
VAFRLEGEVTVPRRRADAQIERLEARAFRIPTESRESDGTLEWDHTTVVVIEVEAGGERGLGFSYADASAALLARDLLRDVALGLPAFDIGRAWSAMVASVRNLGRPGIASTAISAIDIALWDLKARLIGVPLAQLLGQVRDTVPIYGSGGFTSYTAAKLCEQLRGWVQPGIPNVKMKVGREPEHDVERVRLAREAIGDDAELFVDANGAYSRKQALTLAEHFAEHGVSWFEEPVSSDDLEGLHLLRDRAPACMDIAAGEYGFDPWYFERMLSAEAVDVLQADATRCLGLTGFLQAAQLAFVHHVPFSAHTAPSVHLHAGCAVPAIRHLEFFFDHVRIERMLFDGVVEPREGSLRPDLSRPGLGLELKRADADRFLL